MTTTDYTQTQYYGLDKYGDKSPADLRDGHNHNMDVIDKALKDNSEAINGKVGRQEVSDALSSLAHYRDVASMRASRTLRSGDTVCVDGYVNPGDGGRAAWRMYTADAPESRYDVNIDAVPSLCARMVSTQAAPEALGSTDDWTDILGYMMGPDSPVDHLTLMPHVYPCDSMVTQRKMMSIDGHSMAVLDFRGSTGGGVVVDVRNTDNHRRIVGSWSGVRFTGDPDVVFEVRSGIRGYYHDLVFEGFSRKCIVNSGGYENVFRDLQFVGKPSLTSVGIEDNAGDSVYDGIIARDVHTVFHIRSEHTTIGYVHAWIFTPSIISGSSVIKVADNAGNIFVSMIYDDTMETCFDISGNAAILVEKVFDYINPDVWDRTDTALPQRKFGVQWRDSEPKTAGFTVMAWDVFHWNTVPFSTMNITPDRFSGRIHPARTYGAFDMTKYSTPAMGLQLPDKVIKQAGAVLLDGDMLHADITLRLDGLQGGEDVKVWFGLGDILGNSGLSSISHMVDDLYNPTQSTPVYVSNTADLNDITVHVPTTGATVTGYVVIKMDIPIYRKQD